MRRLSRVATAPWTGGWGGTEVEKVKKPDLVRTLQAWWGVQMLSRNCSRMPCWDLNGGESHSYLSLKKITNCWWTDNGKRRLKTIRAGGSRPKWNSWAITVRTHDYKTAVPNLFDTRDWFCGRQFFHGPTGERGEGVGRMVLEWFKTVSAHYVIVHFISSIIVSAPPQIIRH